MKKIEFTLSTHGYYENYKLTKTTFSIVSQEFDSSNEADSLLSELKNKLKAIDDIKKYIDSQHVPSYGFPWHNDIKKILEKLN